MERTARHRTILTVENPRGEYAVLPSTLSRRTKTRNDSIQNKFLHTSLCLETQRRKYNSFHYVESAKHQNALLNFRRSLKQKPWSDNSYSDETPDAFSADVSNLSPVELSRFQLMRQIVATLPGEKVTIEDICKAMKNVGRTFIIDNDNQAVQTKRQPWRSSSFLQKVPESNMDSTKCRLNEDNDKLPKVSSQDDTLRKITTIKETKAVNESVTVTESLLAPTSSPQNKMDSSTNAIEPTRTYIARSVHVSSTPSHTEHVQSDTVTSEKLNPVFITEVNYKLLKSESKGITKVPKVRRHHPVWQIRPTSPTGKRFRKDRVTDVRGPRVDKRSVTLIRRTDPYGLSYKGGAVEKEKVSSKNKFPRDSTVDNIKTVKDRNDRLIAEPSIVAWSDRPRLENSETTPVLQDTKVSVIRPLLRNSETSANSETKHCKPHPFEPKPHLTKTISWKEPLATTAMLVDWDNGAKLQHKRSNPTSNESKQVISTMQLIQLNRTTDHTNMTTSKGQRRNDCGSLKSKSVGSLPSVNNGGSEHGILETESACRRHRQRLVKTPD